MITPQLFNAINFVADEHNITFGDVLMSVETVHGINFLNANTLPDYFRINDILDFDENSNLIDKDIYKEVMSVYNENT